MQEKVFPIILVGISKEHINIFSYKRKVLIKTTNNVQNLKFSHIYFVCIYVTELVIINSGLL
jgi:hypothetical protein